MRWSRKKNGDTRTIKVFALMPITIGDETRWLEWCTIKQTYITDVAYERTIGDWVNACFLNK